jgi:hypothetical protein
LFNNLFAIKAMMRNADIIYNKYDIVVEFRRGNCMYKYIVTDMVFARNGFQNTRYITKTDVTDMVLTTQRLPKVRVTSDVSIASQRLGIPRQQNC